MQLFSSRCIRASWYNYYLRQVTVFPLSFSLNIRANWWTRQFRALSLREIERDVAATLQRNAIYVFILYCSYVDVYVSLACVACDTRYIYPTLIIFTSTVLNEYWYKTIVIKTIAMWPMWVINGKMVYVYMGGSHSTRIMGSPRSWTWRKITRRIIIGHPDK